MSVPSLRLALSARAQRDFAGLLSFSERNWGRPQRLRYRARIERALGELTRFPGLGRSRDEIAAGLRGHRVGEHVIYYRLEEEGEVFVVRILHVRRELTGQFDES